MERYKTIWLVLYWFITELSLIIQISNNLEAKYQ